MNQAQKDQTTVVKILQAANIVAGDKQERETFKQELRELANQAYGLAFFEFLVQSARRADSSENNREIGIIDVPGKCSPMVIDVQNELRVVRERKAALGRQLLLALDQAAGSLSLEDFCQVFELDFDDAWDAMEECDPAANPGGLFTWLIFEYGIESVDSEVHEGILFECILESVLAEIRNSSALQEKCRQKVGEIFGLWQEDGSEPVITGLPLA